MSQPVDALQAALAAEHACIFGYGVAGAHLSGALLDRARACDTVHRTRRDALAATLSALHAAPVVAEAAYALPFPVSTPAAALRLVILLESRTGASWRPVIAVTEDAGLRRTALAALSDTAVRAARWRRSAGSTASTVPFPGQTYIK